MCTRLAAEVEVTKDSVAGERARTGTGRALFAPLGTLAFSKGYGEAIEKGFRWEDGHDVMMLFYQSHACFLVASIRWGEAKVGTGRSGRKPCSSSEGKK